MVYQIGNYNVVIYPDTVFDKGKGYHLICVDKFDDDNQYVGHKHYYFSYLPTKEDFTIENLVDLWYFPVGTKINGQRTIWSTME